MPTDTETPTLTEESVNNIRSLLDQSDVRSVQAEVGGWQPADLAELFGLLTPAERVLLFRALGRDRAAVVFAYLDYEHQNSFLDELTEKETRYLLDKLNPDDRTALFEELPANVTQKMLKLLSPEKLKEARQLLGYPEDSVGRLMTPNYVVISPELTVAEALETVRRTGLKSETVNVIYVTNESGKLRDVLRLRNLIMAEPDSPVESLLNDYVISLSAFDDQQEAVRMIQRYDLYALPVVDSEGTMIGIVTMDDLIDVLEEEATEDFHRAAAVAPLDMSYSQASSPFLVQKRIGWLTILIFVNLISATIIVAYQEYLEAFIALAFFMPLLIATGGNTGAQSATLLVRAISTQDVLPSDWFKVFRKELLVGAILGFGVGLVTWGLGLFRASGEIAMVVGLSMVAIIIIANMLGMILPFVLTKLKLDPATASSPLITTLMDVIGVFIYFALAAMILDLGPINGS